MAGRPDKMDVARAVLQEWRARGGLHASDSFAEDVVFDFSEFQGWMESSEYVGVQAFNEQADRWTDAFTDYTLEITELTDVGGDEVMAIGVQRGLMRDSGAVVEMPTAQIWTLRAGKVTHIRMFASTEDARAAAGLTPRAARDQ